MNNDTTRTRMLPLVLLAALFLLPAVQTLVTVHLEWLTAITYPVLKVVMIAASLLVWRWSRRPVREVLQRVGWRRTNGLVGLAVGAAMAGIILGGYYAIFRSIIQPDFLVDKLRELGLLDYYWAMAVVVSFWNALFEEYYWRGFLLGELRDRLAGRTALVVLMGGLFGLHHIFALLWLGDGWLIAMAVGVTMIAGAAWALLRIRGGSIIDCYISHMMADLAIMWIGYDLVLKAG